jgi:hypothetical protein
MNPSKSSRHARPTRPRRASLAACACLLAFACSNGCSSSTGNPGGSPSASGAAAPPGTGIVCTGDWHAGVCQCAAADHTDTGNGCFEVGQPYPCCAKTGIAVGAPGYQCSCSPDLPMAQPQVSCAYYHLAGYCECTTGQLGITDAAFRNNCSAATGHSCYATRTADAWSCTCADSGSGSGQAVADCTPPADLAVHTCPAGTYATDNCDGNCHPEQCTGCGGQTCDSTGCQGNQKVCSANKCIQIPAGGTCGFSNLP